MNTYLVTDNLAARPSMLNASLINAHDAEAAAEMWALLFMRRLDTSVVVLAVRDIRDRAAGRVTVEIQPTRNGPAEAVAIGSRFPFETEGEGPEGNAPAICVGTPPAAAAAG